MSNDKRAPRLPWSTTEDQVVRDNYGQRSVTEISAMLPGRSVKAIDNRAWRLDISRRDDLRPWTEAEDALIRESYEDHTAKKMAARLDGRSLSAVTQRMTRLGLNKRAEFEEHAHAFLATLREPPTRGFPEASDPVPVPLPYPAGIPMARKTFITRSTIHGYFAKVTTAEQAYIIGLLAADGNIASDHPRVQLGLVAPDMRAVEFARDRLNPAAPLSKAKDGRMILQVTSRQMVADLARFGIVPRKSRVLAWPHHLGDLQRPFLLGYSDGDGSMFMPRDRYGREYPGWEACSGSGQFVTDLKEYILASTGVRLQRIHRRKDADLWKVQITGLGAIVVDRWLHQDGLGLARKRIPERALTGYGV